MRLLTPLVDQAAKSIVERSLQSFQAQSMLMYFKHLIQRPQIGFLNALNIFGFKQWKIK